MTDTTSTVANAVVTIIAFMRSHRVKTIGQAYDLPQFPVGALGQALPGYEYPEISGLTARQLTRRAAKPVTEQQADRAVALTTANPDMTVGEAEHVDGQHLHHEPGCGLYERERLADAAKVEREAEAVATAADVANSSRPASGRVYDIEQRLIKVEQLLLALAENVTAKGKDMPTANAIGLAVARLNEQRANLRQLERDLVRGRVRR